MYDIGWKANALIKVNVQRKLFDDDDVDDEMMMIFVSFSFLSVSEWNG